MSKFEFCGQNLGNTTSMLLSISGSGTFAYLYDRNTALDYVTDGYTGATSTTLNIVFDVPTVVSRIFLQPHNLKTFRIYYNSATANTFTPDCNVSTNSTTNHYFAFASTTVSSIQLQMDNVIEAGQERSIGELVISDLKSQFDVNPSADNYDPKLFKQKIRHVMPDGGTSLFIVGNKFQAGMKLKFVSTAFKDELVTIYNDGNPFYFLPEPTTTAWLGNAYEMVWVNDWNFTYSENSKTQGWDGSIVIEETPGA